MLPDSLTPAALTKLTQMYSNNKDLLRSDYTYYIDQALANPDLAILLLNNQYMYAVVDQWLSKDNKDMIEQLRPYLKLVLHAIKDPQVRKALNWSLVRSDADKISAALKGKDRELEKLSAEIVQETKKSK
jgi:hypothetical protein